MSLSFSTDESIMLMLELVEGDPQQVTAVTAVIRMVPTGTEFPMVATWQEAQGSVLHGWRLSLPGGLPTQNVYELDARIQSGANSYVTDKLRITVNKAVTPR